MSTPTFGTDGIRGRVPDEVDEAVAHAVARAFGRRFPGSAVVVGADTRESSPALAAAVLAGLQDAGCTALDAGVLPTPGVIHLCDWLRVPGVVVTASHNPYHDNGIKLIARGGGKASPELERELEAEIAEHLSGEATTPTGGPAPAPRSRPELPTAPELRRSYVDWLLWSSGVDLSGLRVALDCGNGATAATAPEVFRRLGATVTALNTEPDGRNINAGVGAVAPEAVAEVVRDGSFDIGFTFDGDGDRVLAVTGDGTLLDGDDLVWLLATQAADALGRSGGVVVTEWSNVGLVKAVSATGLRCEVVAVGDRNVKAGLDATGGMVGGESSGHIIMPALSPSGDGVLTALQLCRAVTSTGPWDGLRDLLFHRVPSVSRSLRVQESPQQALDRVADVVASARAEIGDDGRVAVRASGTEPVVRVLVESEDATQAERALDGILAALRR